MSITINGATNTITAASGLAIAGNTAVNGTLGVTGALTGAAGSFTTLSASGVLTLGTTGAADTQLRSGALDANSSYFQSVSADGTTAKNFKWYVGATDVMNLSSTGLTLGTGVNLVMASGYVEGSEMTAPAAPAANGFRIFAEDNGAGKTRLMVQFATGAPQQIAIEP